MIDHKVAPVFDGTFPHRWQAEILPERPLILPFAAFRLSRRGGRGGTRRAGSAHQA